MSEPNGNSLSDAPSDLAAHLNDFPGLYDEETEIRLLDEETSGSFSFRIREALPLAKKMGLVVLDDSNTSDHHCYVTAGPATGMILNLTHDGEPELAFDSLAKYLKEIRRLIREEEFIDEIEYQVEIEEGAVLNAERFIDDNFSSLLPEELCVYIKLVRASNESLLDRLSKHSNFIVREFVGFHVTNNPHADALAVAQQLADDEISQVAAAGARAVAAIENL